MPHDISAMIDRLSLDQVIGQLFMGNICGGENLDFARRNFDTFHFGALQFSGVFERFVRGGDYLPCGVCRNAPLEDVAAFLAEVKQAGRDITGLPVIMAGDQEGSISNSIFRRRNVSLMPSQMGFGAGASLEDTYAAARVSAREVKTLGLDMLYGPCLDVLLNAANPEIGARAFHSDPERVAALGEQFVRAYAAENVISNIKHFPGRGAGASDAHRELESIDMSRSELLATSVEPFRRALAAGADTVMLAHTLYPGLEPEYLPASLSPRIVTGLLREELGFDGVVLPDDLTMFAISQNFGIPRAAAMCLEAGADMVFMKVPEQYAPTVAAIKESLRAGRLSEARLRASVCRVLALKQKRGLFTPPTFSREQVTATVGCVEHAVIARHAAEHALTVVKNAGVLPLHASSLLVAAPRDMNVVLSNDPLLSHDMLANALQRHYPDVQGVVIDESPTVPQHFETVGRAKNVDAIIFGIYSAGCSAGQLALLNELAALGKPIIVVITNSPYAATQMPTQTGAILCSFGMSTFAFTAIAEMIACRLAPVGTLPVKLEMITATTA